MKFTVKGGAGGLKVFMHALAWRGSGSYLRRDQEEAVLFKGETLNQQ